MAKNDKRGRRHTSTITVSILEDASQDVELEESDIVEKFTRGSGPGGQHKNKTDTKVVVTHIPTGIVASADSRSQWNNRQQARKNLAVKIAQQQTAGNDRKPTPERSAKSFTYNAQRDEVLSHVDGRRWQLSRFMKGRIW